MAKYDGTSVDAVEVLNCVNKALQKVKMVDQLVKERLEEDGKRRDKGGLMAELSAENER